MPPCVCVCVCGMWEKREKVTKRYERRSPHVFMCRLRARERTKKSQDEQERLSKLPIFFSFFLFLKRCDCKEETFFFFFRFWKVIAYGLTELVRAPLLLQSGNLHQLFTGFYLVFFFCTLLSFSVQGIRDRELNDIRGSLPVVTQFR